METSNQSVTLGLRRNREELVRIKDLKYSYGTGDTKKYILTDIDINVAAGEIIILTGPSGCGKTTLLTLIGGLRTVKEGSLIVDGQQMRGATTGELVQTRRRLGFIFQAHNLFESLTAFQNVRMSMELFGMSADHMKSRAEDLLTRLGLGERIHYKPENLSGGQKQRVAICRGLAHKPKIILADEPTAALDKESSKATVTLFREMAQQEGVAIIIVTHDTNILWVADRIVKMEDGRIKSDVNPEEAKIICDYLRQSPMFEKLSVATLTSMADQMCFESFSAGDKIIQQGDEGDKFYLLREGNVTVSLEQDGSSRELAKLHDGDFFGETALVFDQPRNATVTADDDVILYSLGKEEFKAVLNQSESFEQEVRRTLYARR